MTDDRNRGSSIQHTDSEEIGHILDVVSERVPKLIAAIKNAIYSPEAGRELGRSVGAFHKELVEAGIPADMSAAMAKDYLSGLQSALSRAANGTSTVKIERGREPEENDAGK